MVVTTDDRYCLLTAGIDIRFWTSGNKETLIWLASESRWRWLNAADGWRDDARDVLRCTLNDRGKPLFDWVGCW
jgi:hypothetical protein